MRYIYKLFELQILLSYNVVLVGDELDVGEDNWEFTASTTDDFSNL